MPTEEKNSKEDVQPTEDTGKKAVDSLVSSPFVDQDARFDVSVNFVRIGENVFVENKDEDYQEKVDEVGKDKVAAIVVSFKYPDTGDCDQITLGSTHTGVQLQFKDFTKLELIRMLVLIKGWNQPMPLDNQEILKLHPKITRAILDGLIDRLGNDGLV